MYKQLSVDTRAMQLNVNSDVFAQEWIRCFENQDRDVGFLAKLLQPYFDHWTHMLTTPGSQKDLGYITFAQLLEIRKIDPVDDLPIWVEAMINNKELQSVFESIIYAQLRYLKYYPKKAERLEYLISYDFRRRLSWRITRFFRHRVDIPSPASTFQELVYKDTYPDWLLIKNAGWSNWEEYLVMLHLRGISSAYELSANTRIPSTTIQREEGSLWDRLKQMRLHPE